MNSKPPIILLHGALGSRAQPYSKDYQLALAEEDCETVECKCANSIYWAEFYDEITCYTTSTMYWYHPDYLGNVEWVTKADGTAHQFFWYSPWGEPLEEHHVGTGDFFSRYRFNAKELDEETGNYYYGARYYDPKVSVWLSVDPMSSERPGLTPYNFMSNNPVMRIDPTGMLDGWVEGEDGNIAWDADVSSQQDLVDQGKCGSYKGEEGTGFNPGTGNNVMYNKDGSSYEYGEMLGSAEVVHTMNDHERALDAGRRLGIYQGQNDFLSGSFDLSTELIDKTGKSFKPLKVCTKPLLPQQPPPPQNAPPHLHQCPSGGSFFWC